MERWMGKTPFWTSCDFLCDFFTFFEILPSILSSFLRLIFCLYFVLEYRSPLALILSCVHICLPLDNSLSVPSFVICCIFCRRYLSSRHLTTNWGKIAEMNCIISLWLKRKKTNGFYLWNKGFFCLEEDEILSFNIFRERAPRKRRRNKEKKEKEITE